MSDNPIVRILVERESGEISSAYREEVQQWLGVPTDEDKERERKELEKQREKAQQRREKFRQEGIEYDKRFNEAMSNLDEHIQSVKRKGKR